MRMRKKKHLDERVEACGKWYIRLLSDDLNFESAIEKKDYIDTAALFGNDNPIYLEIGCGKGQFACQSALLNPGINFLAVERSCNVIVQACEKAKNLGLENIRFIDCNAMYLPKFLKDNTISRIYLNFSCPYPKKSYASHRLTHKNFLKIYDMLLAPGGEIHQKTDNAGLFEFSIEQLSDYGFTVKNVSLDLHGSDFEGNIETEYEAKFAALGQPIYRLEAYLKEKE
ncbi:MAG: tRNA (guanosine(46)-N7)-methyltransferase TrmB [Clostridia bacterium]|nr:tRNA (guanosine(46)-N7)-methyltransferase TrmB [Clostridia bacterium]